MSFTLDKNTTFEFNYSNSTAISFAINILKRDFNKVLSSNLQEAKNANVVVSIDMSITIPEQYCINVSSDKIIISCADELAFIYAILHISREYLGVDNFWFWTEKEPALKSEIQIEETTYLSPIAKVKYRGWFVNDEVCLIGWSKVYPPSRDIWECVFETLLRLGGNMVIPGTDLPREGEHFDIATQMGLYITHHHAEPLGSEMFLRAYPNEEASYDKNPHLFEKLWQDAIDKNKDKKIVWTLGFRGQGDAPFWHNDPKYTTAQSRADVIRKVIDKQYSMLLEKTKNPVCAVYLYGEITELYEAGYLKLPKEFIKIWSDNGYGKMVTRRCGNHNPRVLSLPTEDGKHGLYYHVTFHDLQASSHLTLLGNPPEFVNDELDRAFTAGATDYLLLNCGNIRPHIYMLDLVSKIWTYGKINITKFKNHFTATYLDNNTKALDCYNDYFNCVPKYGIHPDDKAGDEFYYHPARQIISSWAIGDTKDCVNSLVWATGEIPFLQQVKWFKKICLQSLEHLELLVDKCERVSLLLSDTEKVFFDDNISFQSKLHLSGAKGLIALCTAFEQFDNKEFAKCFVTLTDSIQEYKEGEALLRQAEHDKWENFYSADWLTNVSITIYAVDSIRRFVRLIDDGPDFFKWFKNYVMPETERQIYLENTQRETLSDDELANRLRQVL